jgi:hypothetical protein
VGQRTSEEKKSCAVCVFMQTEEKHALEDQVQLLSHQLQPHANAWDAQSPLSCSKEDGQHCPRKQAIHALASLQGTLQIAASIQHASDVHTNTLDLMTICRLLKNMVIEEPKTDSHCSSVLAELNECVAFSQVRLTCPCQCDK